MLFRSQVAQRSVGRDAVEPAEKGAVAAKRGKAAMCAEEYILDHVLDVARMAQVTRHVPRNAPLVFDDERLERLRIARLREPDEFCVLVHYHHRG